MHEIENIEPRSYGPDRTGMGTWQRTQPRFRFPFVWTAVCAAAVVIGYVTAYTTLVYANGLGQSPAQASALCASLSISNDACRTLTTTADVGQVLLGAGILALIGVGIRTAIRYQRWQKGHGNG